MGLPGLSATPWTTMPGSLESARRAVARDRRRPWRCRRTAAPCRGRERSRRAPPTGRLVVGTDARAAPAAPPCSVDRRAEDRGVGIVDRAGAAAAGRARTISSPVEIIATGAAHDQHLGQADRGQHADLARGQDAARAQHRLAARDVAAGGGDAAPGAAGAAQLDPDAPSAPSRELGLLDHHHGIGAARQHAAGRDQRWRCPGRPRAPAAAPGSPFPR